MSFSSPFRPNRCHAYIILLSPKFYISESHHSQGVVFSLVFFTSAFVYNVRTYPYHVRPCICWLSYLASLSCLHMRKLRRGPYCTHFICLQRRKSTAESVTSAEGPNDGRQVSDTPMYLLYSRETSGELVFIFRKTGIAVTYDRAL